MQSDGKLKVLTSIRFQLRKKIAISACNLSIVTNCNAIDCNASLKYCLGVSTEGTKVEIRRTYASPVVREPGTRRAASCLEP